MSGATMQPDDAVLMGESIGFEPEPDFDGRSFAASTGASSSALEALQTYLEMLADWNSRMNLVGPSALASFWRRHAYDSAQLLTFAPSAKVWADLGSGAGLPGIVLAILLKETPGAHVHLVESMIKRTRFLAEVAAKLDLPVTIHTCRAEDLRPPKGLEVVTARACAPLSRLLSFAYPCLRTGAMGLFLKGRDVEHELTEARLAWHFDVRLHNSLRDASGRVIQLQKVTRV
jgi:16S rRNA (guanine527-N7)-methyltransferase